MSKKPEKQAETKVEPKAPEQDELSAEEMEEASGGIVVQGGLSLMNTLQQQQQQKVPVVQVAGIPSGKDLAL